MNIVKSKIENITTFQELWSLSIDYQKNKGCPTWPKFPVELIEKEIISENHYSIYTSDNKLCGYFSLVFNDSLIWEELELNDAIYIHRMCVNQKVEKINLSSIVLEWTYTYAKKYKRKFIRMDTWGDNKQLINHYINCGYKYKRNKFIYKIPELPSHYDNINLAMFENEVLT